MNINLHIERLVLDGINITSGQQHILHASVNNELRNLLNNGGLTSNIVDGAAVPRLSTSAIKLYDVKPIQLGQKIARSVYGGIGNE